MYPQVAISKADEACGEYTGYPPIIKRRPVLRMFSERGACASAPIVQNKKGGAAPSPNLDLSINDGVQVVHSPPFGGVSLCRENCSPDEMLLSRVRKGHVANSGNCH